ncbi:MAG: metallophosphoesterase family protein [Pseudomonadota bacterium]
MLASSRPPAFRLLHLSDPHFGAERPEVVEALLRLAAAQSPDLCVVSGDLTQRARPAQFRRAAAFFERLRSVTDDAPQLLVPGNHDVPLINLWARWRSPYQLYCDSFAAPPEGRFESDDVVVFGVNTSTPRRRVDGEVTVTQREAIAAALTALDDARLKVVVVHQPVAVPAHSQRQRLLHGGREAALAWGRAGADLVLGGHIHLPYALPLQASLEGLPRPLWLVHAGTAVSDRLRMGAPNSVNELLFETATRRLRLRRWDFSETRSAFLRRSDRFLALAGAYPGEWTNRLTSAPQTS